MKNPFATLRDVWVTIVRALLLFSALLAIGVSPLIAKAESTDWSVAVLDQILAKVEPGQALARVGDMDILATNLMTWRNHLAGSFSPASAFTGGTPTWTGGNVYYAFTNTLSVSRHKAFLDAAGEWAMFANLRFIPRTTQNNYIMVLENPSIPYGGRSAVGMVGGQQLLEINPTAWNRGLSVMRSGTPSG
jgi:Astacin (Peptidase family M12A)